MNEKALLILIRLARAQAEARQIEVARIVEAIQGLNVRDAMMAAALEAERESASLSPGAATAAFGAYAARIKRERAALAAQKVQLEAHEAALRAVLADAFLELKKLERLQEERAARQAHQAQARETVQMDAVAARISPSGRRML